MRNTSDGLRTCLVKRVQPIWRSRLGRVWRWWAVTSRSFMRRIKRGSYTFHTFPGQNHNYNVGDVFNRIYTCIGFSRTDNWMIFFMFSIEWGIVKKEQHLLVENNCRLMSRYQPTVDKRPQSSPIKVRIMAFNWIFWLFQMLRSEWYHNIDLSHDK